MSIDTLMIVESPSKAKTIQHYLGKGFLVLASYGHVRDLVPKGGAVKVTDSVAMKYQVVVKNKAHLEKIHEAALSAKTILLATDPDREGEAIAYHLIEYLKEQGVELQNKEVSRVIFYEITKNAIQESVKERRAIDTNLIDAQQARRALDYLVGFSLSPVLWRKIKPGLSAGRVQSPALKLIVTREKEIQAFFEREYWSLLADLSFARKNFQAKLTEYQGEKLQQFSITTQSQAQSIMTQVKVDADGVLVVQSVVAKSRKRSPAPPFTTSTLQQEAARKVNFSALQTMRVAQQLYEGVAISGQQKGLITYMRTDSLSLSKDAITDCRQTITSSFGKDFLSKQVRVFKTKTKNAQEAHEGIRPTDFSLSPAEIRGSLTPDQYKLYKLIWDRTLASQMADAIYEDQVLSMMAQGSHKFEARRSSIEFEGYLKLYIEGTDDQDEDDDTLGDLFKVKEGDHITLKELETKKHVTEPPARFTEATLVKALEAFGIGRPSTYASIISTLRTRGYAELKQKRFFPTDTGMIVHEFLDRFFQTYVDYPFTAKMEDLLDDVSNGQVQWTKVIIDFWGPFTAIVGHVLENISKKEATEEKLEEACPKCAQPLVKKFGKLGRFIGCTAYPECTYTRPVEGGKEPEEDQPELHRDCPTCSKALTYKRGRFGVFIGCTGYPDCRYIESLKKQSKDTAVECPKCQEGTLLEKKSRRGTTFYSCSRYPKCDLTLSAQPIKKTCPQCQYPVMMYKEGKRLGRIHVCPIKTCGYKESLPNE